MMRRRGPGLVGTVARTAVVAGTASAVSGRVHRRQQERWATEADEQAAAADAQAMQEQMAAMQAQQAQAAMQQSAGGGDLMAQLQKLSEMKESGVLSEEEFAAAKAKLLT